MGARDRHAEIRVLDAMYVLEQFTLADLWQYASASPEATETAVRRWRRVLETVGKRPARTGRGRPQYEYRLTEAGQAELSHELSRLPQRQPAPARSKWDVPGLGLARHILAEELSGAELEQRRALIAEAESSFSSARRRLGTSGPAALMEEVRVVDFLFDLCHLEDALATNAVTDAALQKVRSSLRRLPDNLGNRFPEVLNRMAESPARDLADLSMLATVPDQMAIVNLGVDRWVMDRVKSAVRLLGLTPQTVPLHEAEHWLTPVTASHQPLCVMVTYKRDAFSRLDDLVSNKPARSPMVVLSDHWNSRLQKRAIGAGARFVCLTGLDKSDLATALDVERDPYFISASLQE